MSPILHTSASPMPVAAVRAGERWCRASGLAAAVLTFLAGAFAPNPPMQGGTDAALVAHFGAHYAGTLQGAFTATLGAMALLLFAVALVHGAARLRRAAHREAGVLSLFTLLAGVVAVGMLVAAQAVAAATAVIGHHATDMAVPRGLDEVGHMLAHLSVLPLGLFTLAAGLTLADAGFGPRWLARAGAGMGAYLALSGTWVFVGDQRLHNAGALGWMGMMLWLAVQGVALALADRPAREPIAAAAPLTA
jgi:hypothetical protein